MSSFEGVAHGPARTIETLRRRIYPATGYGRGLLAVALLYAGLYGALLGVTRGLPYVTDGNESFSMLIHASNLYHFPISQTFGLADEALSSDPAAHPYVYTHQGNFPRVFAFILYSLGARTVESQIVITTFTVGALSVFLLYHYFATITTPLFAFIAAAVALTDYLFFVQWQVNTFRVWHGLFLYLALWCVHAVGGPRRRRWLALTIVAYASMFYFELAFAAFVAVMAGLYAAAWHWKRPSLLLRCWAAQVAGAVVAVVTLVGQLIGYLGWADFLEDLRITYTARNLVMADPAYLDRLREFVETRHLVFWYNFAPVEYQRSAYEILSAITGGYFTTYTPALWYVVVILLTGWVVGVFRRPQSAYPAAALRIGDQSHTLACALPVAVLFVAWTRFLLALARPDGLAGVSGPRLSFEVEVDTWILGPVALLAAGLTVWIVRLVTGQWSGVRRLPSMPALLASALLLLSEHLVLNSASLFDTFYALLWAQVQGAWFPGWVVQSALVVASTVAVLMAFNRPIASPARWPPLAAYLGCGCAAFVVVYILSPGYIRSGYLDRSVAFFSFILQTAIALVLYVVVRIVGRLIEGARSAALETSASVSERICLPLSAGALALLLVFAVSYWVNLQATYARLLPATHFGFMKQLGNEPFRGASFASNTYAAPIYAYTGQWAYFDTRLGLGDGGAIAPSGDGFTIDRDARTYLWLADRESNRSYERPDYFLCFWYQDLRLVVYRQRQLPIGCSTGGVVGQAIRHDKPSVGEAVVRQDPTGNDNWAIVKLTWDVLDHSGVSSEARLE